MPRASAYNAQHFAIYGHIERTLVHPGELSGNQQVVFGFEHFERRPPGPPGHNRKSRGLRYPGSEDALHLALHIHRAPAN